MWGHTNMHETLAGKRFVHVGVGISRRHENLWNRVERLPAQTKIDGIHGERSESRKSVKSAQLGEIGDIRENLPVPPPPSAHVM